MTVTEKAARDRMEKQAIRSLKMLRASMALGEEPDGLCLKSEEGWTLSYGPENTVDLPPLSDVEILTLLIECANLPLPRVVKKPCAGRPI